MNKFFGEILEKEIKKKFKNQSAFAQEIGITQATVSRYINGSAVPSFNVLQKMSDVLGINLISISKDENSTSESYDNQDIISIPYYYSEVSAGHGAATDTEYNDHITFDRKWIQNTFLLKNINNLFSLRVKGDSMDPLISEGDVVFAQKHTSNSYPDGVCIVQYNGEYFIKKLQFKPMSSINLISHNKEYDNIEIPLNSEEIDFKVIGKVVGKISAKSFVNF